MCQPPSWAQKASCTALSCPSTSGAGHRSRCLKGNRSSLCSLGAQETSGMGRGVDLLWVWAENFHSFPLLSEFLFHSPTPALQNFSSCQFWKQQDMQWALNCLFQGSKACSSAKKLPHSLCTYWESPLQADAQSVCSPSGMEHGFQSGLHRTREPVPLLSRSAIHAVKPAALTPDVVAQFLPATVRQVVHPSQHSAFVSAHVWGSEQKLSFSASEFSDSDLSEFKRKKFHFLKFVGERKCGLYCCVEVYVFSWEKKVPYVALQKEIFSLEFHTELTKRKNKYLWGKPDCLSTLHLQVACSLQHIHSPSENLALVLLVARLSKSFSLWQPTRIAKEHTFLQLVIFANLSEMKCLHIDFVDTTENCI